MVIPAEPAPARAEHWEACRYIKAPRWCETCDAGCSFESCWLCAGPTVDLPRSRRPLSDGKMTWRPELDR